MMRVRLKADGRLVAILPDGSEGPLLQFEDQPVRDVWAPPLVPNPLAGAQSATTGQSAGSPDSATYARRIRANVKLTQTEFALRIGVPVETVRNWEQGKRVPRGPARALLKLIEHAPDVAFSVLRQEEATRS
ncbi:MAG TPA: helix-turn-helix domain-containing protein [Xanthobacteraceae bacterium]|nr:helix-turn-helix domain-containing protein [Xanthobacteraceae bacterium]